MSITEETTLEAIYTKDSLKEAKAYLMGNAETFFQEHANLTFSGKRGRKVCHSACRRRVSMRVLDAGGLSGCLIWTSMLMPIILLFISYTVRMTIPYRSTMPVALLPHWTKLPVDRRTPAERGSSNVVWGEGCFCEPVAAGSQKHPFPCAPGVGDNLAV